MTRTMTHLKRLGNSITVPISPDQDQFTGRECPNPDCEGYFKVEFGTGLKGKNLPCHCPYCGHVAPHDQFWTKEQIEYAQSVVVRQFTDAVQKDLKKFEFKHKPKGMFGLGISLKVIESRQTPIHHYREKQLETEVVCGQCTLRYAVYGVFGFCPDCGLHNSLHILEKSLEIVMKLLDLAVTLDATLSEKLIENALEDCISTFDGFGREICRLNAVKATNSTKAEKISFQNLEGAKQNIKDVFNVDIGVGVTIDEWKTAILSFQKRHLLSHKAGVVDDEYIRKTGDTKQKVGRKVTIYPEEIQEIIRIVRKLAQYTAVEISK